jgi:receptor protein-tyrosine kinase
MGRIEEALRRSGAAGSAMGEEDGVFVSAWNFPEQRVAVIPEVEWRAVPAQLQALPVPSRTPKQRGLDDFDPRWKERLISWAAIDPAFAAQFRRLAATLIHAQNVHSTKLVMVTSALPADGKTLTTLNLALALSESYRRRVLIVDADLRRPSLTRAAGCHAKSGLSEVLKAHDARKAALIPLTETLTLLPAGSPDPDPLGGLTSSRMRTLLDEASSEFDWVLLDAPPVEAVPDGGLLAAMVDTVLLVVRAGRTQYAPVTRAIETIGRERILGVVLNGTEDGLNHPYPDYFQPSPGA